MRIGLEELSKATLGFVNGLQSACMEATGVKKLRSAASRMMVFASAKTLVVFAKNIEYEPLKALKVGVIDVHSELNRFLVAWIHNKGAKELAEGLVDLFEDFNEHEVEEESAPPSPASNSPDSSADEETEMLSLLRDAMVPVAYGNARQLNLPSECLNDQVASDFATGVERALEHMLQKRKRSMQMGLKELADVVVDTFEKMFPESASCKLSIQGTQLKKGAMKLKALTRKTVVDYGTHIKYEALKSLVVGDVDIHMQLNEFISAWKLRSPKEAGKPLGQLLRRLSTISGHDEL